MDIKDTKIITQNQIESIVGIFKEKVKHLPESLTIQNHLLDAILKTIK